MRVDVKPNIVEVSLIDRKVELLQKVITALEPVRKYRALFKAKEALEGIATISNGGSGFSVWSRVIHYDNTEMVEFRKYGWVPDGVEDLYQTLCGELAAYKTASVAAPTIYVRKLVEFLEYNFNEAEMKVDDFKVKKSLIRHSLQQAMNALDVLTANGESFELTDE